MTVRRNILKHEQVTDLTVWVVSQNGALADMSPTRAAGEATKALGFRVDSSKVKEVAQRAGIELGRSKRSNLGRRQPGTRVEVVATRLIELLKRLGEPVPQDLECVSRRLRLPEKGDTDEGATP